MTAPPAPRQMKWHEACLSISAAILEILNAWENGVLAFESIQVGSSSPGAGQVWGHDEAPCPPSTLEAEAGELLGIQGQPGLHSESKAT